MNRLEQQLQRRHGLELVGRDRVRARRRKGRRPLPKLQVELLEDRRLLSTLDITNNVLTYTADAGSASDLTIGIDSANTSDVSVQDPGHTVTLTGDTSQWSLGTDGEANGPISSFTSIVVNGLTSSGQNLTIDYSHGDPLPATGLSFNPTAATGQVTNNLSLSTRNGTFVVFSSETYAPTGAGAGTITYSDSTNSNVPVSFTNLSPVNDTMPATTFIFTAPATATAVNVNTGPVLGVQTDQINDGGTAQFELINFANKTAVTVNTPAAGATTTLNIPTVAAGLSTLNVVSGAGGETVNVQAIPAGINVGVDTGSASGSTTNVGLAGSLAAILSPVLVQSTGGTNALALNDSGEASGHTYTITGSSVTAPTVFPSHVDFGTGITTLDLTTSDLGDTVNLTGLIQSDVTTYNLSAAGAGANTLNVDVRPDSISTLDLNTSGVLTFGAGNPVVNYSNFQPVNVFKTASQPVGAGVTINANAGQPLNNIVVATFTESDLGNAPADFTATIDWGDGTATSPGVIQASGPNGYNILGTHIYATTGTHTINVTLTDNGSMGTTVVSGVTINVTSTGPVSSTPNPIVSSANIAAAPLTAMGATISGFKGIALNPTAGGDVLAATFMDTGSPGVPADYTATIDWGDGSTPTAATRITSQGTPNGVVFSIFGNHTYSSTGVFPVTVTIVKTASGSTAIASSTADVALQPPSTNSVQNLTGIPFSAAQDVQTTQEVATFTSTDTSALPSDYTASINWGDGTATTAGSITLDASNVFRVAGTHTYTKAGSFTPVVTIRDPFGALTTTPAFTATVAAAPLTAQGATVRGTEGIALNPTAGGDILVATFIDTGTPGLASTYTATIDWGDGSTATAATRITAQGTANGTVYSVFGNHTYYADGTFPVTITITNTADGAVAIASSQAVITPMLIADTPPTVTTPERTLFSGPVAEFTDPNPTGTPTVFSALIDWGDGSPNSAGTITLVSSTATSTTFLIGGTHTYADLYGTPTATSAAQTSSTFPLSIHVVGTDGSSINLSNTATVTGGPFTVSGRLDPSSDSGSSNSDDITDVVQPVFDGTTGEPFARVSVYAGPVGTTNPTAGTLLGTTTAGSTGAWSLTSGVALADGGYTITALAIDATNSTITNTATIVPDLVIDTVGPKVTSLAFERFQGQIVVTYQDLGGVNNAGVGLNMASVIDASNYQLTSVHHPRVGEYRFNVISDVPGTTTGTQTVTLSVNGGHYIKGGWYFFTIRSASPSNPSGVRDIAGNALDGEFYGYFPSGNNIRGGDFVAQLTAIHHTIYAPSTVIGRGTPVSPPGGREHSVYVRATYNPSKFPPITATASRPQAARQAVKRVQHSEAAVSHRLRQVGGPMVATSTSTSNQPTAIGALGTLDQALDQIGVSNKHRKS